MTDLERLENHIYPQSIITILDEEMDALPRQDSLQAEILAFDTLHYAVWAADLPGLNALSQLAPRTAAAIRAHHPDLAA